MNIGRHNYEVIIIDYLDGKLLPDQVGELFSFLQSNPDIQEEFDGLKDAILFNEHVIYPNKNSLKKHDGVYYGVDSEVDYLCIASIEGDATLQENQVLNNYLTSDPGIKRTLLTYQQTKITQNQEVVYPHKAQLKRSVVFNLTYYNLRFTLKVAAVLIVFFGGLGLLQLMRDDSIKTANVSPTIISSAIIENKEPAIEKKTVISESENRTNHVKINKQHLADNNESKIEVRDRVYYPFLQPRTIAGLHSKEIKEINNSNLSNALQQTSFNNLASALQGNNGIQSMNGTKVVGLFEIAQLGLNSFGKLIGRDIKLDAKRNKKGEIKQIRFESALIAFSAPISKNEE